MSQHDKYSRKMGGSNKSIETGIKNRTCYYFDA